MVKWQPFASMPEQFAGIREIMGELNKVPKPTLTQDTKERIERALIDSAQRQEDILISFYRDGFISNMYITVIRIDLHTNTVHCTDAFNLHTEFKFDEIVDVADQL